MLRTEQQTKVKTNLEKATVELILQKLKVLGKSGGSSDQGWCTD